MCRLSWNLGASTSCNSLGLSSPVMGLLYLLPYHARRSRNSSVGTVIRVGYLGFDSQQETRLFLFPKTSWPALEPTQPPGVICRWEKRPGHEVVHTLPSTAAVKNEWSYSSYYTPTLYLFTSLHAHRGKQWQTTPKNLPRMQRARAIPVAWLGSGSCQNRPKGWILIIIIIIIICPYP
jgi:hypothetical protein